MYYTNEDKNESIIYQESTSQGSQKSTASENQTQADFSIFLFMLIMLSLALSLYVGPRNNTPNKQ